jgi:hypothetical protein
MTTTRDQLADTQEECESLRRLTQDEIIRLVRAETDRRSTPRPDPDRRLTPPRPVE